MSAYTAGGAVGLVTDHGDEHVETVSVTADLFGTLGARPFLGRFPDPQQEQLSAVPGAMLSEQFWRRRFGASPNALGKIIRLRQLSGKSIAYRVAGVMPGWFQFPRELTGIPPDVWVPLAVRADAPYGLGHDLSVVGRLRAGVTIAQARAEMQALAQRLALEYPDREKGWGVSVDGWGETATGRSREIVIALLLAGVLLVLIACANDAALAQAEASASTTDTESQRAESIFSRGWWPGLYTYRAFRPPQLPAPCLPACRLSPPHGRYQSY